MPTHLAEPVQHGEGNQVAAVAPSPTEAPKHAEDAAQTGRLAYSVQEAADLLGVSYYSVYRLVQRGKLIVQLKSAGADTSVDRCDRSASGDEAGLEYRGSRPITPPSESHRLTTIPPLQRRETRRLGDRSQGPGGE